MVATMTKLTYQNQVWNDTRRPGVAADGPPYGPPGMWSTFAYHPDFAASAAGMRQVFMPMSGEARLSGSRKPENYRAVGVNGRGKIVAEHPVIDASGTLQS